MTVKIDVEFVYRETVPVEAPVTRLPREDELLEKSVTVKLALSGRYVVVTPVANDTEVVFVKPTGDPKLEFADVVIGLVDTEVPLPRTNVVEVVVYVLPVARLLG